jgi:putative ABC transport system permease protein
LPSHNSRFNFELETGNWKLLEVNMRGIRQRLRSILWRVPLEQEVRDELAHHVELRTRELVERGIDPVIAQQQALARFGDVAQMEARLRDLGSSRDRVFARQDWWDEFRQDVRFAFRQAKRQPGFSAAAVLTLALGLGATTAIFSVVYAVVLRPLPFAHPDRTVLTFTQWRGGLGGLAVGNFDYIRQRTTTLEQAAGLQYSSFNLSEGEAPERILGARTTANFFTVFGVPTLHGRTYTLDEDQPGRGRVVVLTHRFWQRRFPGNVSIIGRQLRMNGEQYDVIGIMPPSFDEISTTTDVYVPIAFTAERLAMHDEHYLQVYALRKPSASLAQIDGDLSRIAESLRRDFPRDAAEISFTARDMRDFITEDYRLRLYVLLAAVGLVLVIACVNVANLLIARLAARARELAIRAAIGAGRGRIVRQVLTESLVLASAGGAVGLLFAYWGLPVLIANAPEGIPRLETASLNRAVIAAAFGLVLASSVIVGLLPAWQATRRRDLREELGDGKGATGGNLKPWIRQALIGGQAALVLIVLAGAALLVRSAINLQYTALGFDPSGVLSARVALPTAQYRGPDQIKIAFQQLLTEVAASPLVDAASLDSQTPLVGGGGGTNGLVPEGRPLAIQSAIPSRSHFVSPDYFNVLRIPLRAGRAFTPQDVRNAPLVMIINERLAREAFGETDPIGKRITCCEGGPDTPVWKTVVGVVADVRAQGPAQPPSPEFYLPVTQIPDAAWTWMQNAMNIVVRSKTGDPAAMSPVIRRAVRNLDPSLPVYRVSTLEEGFRETMAQARFNTSLMALLGVIGLVLAALGIYGVIAWLVAQRTREIGLRMALGASAGSVVRDVTLHGLRPVVVGLAIGLAGALVAGRLLEGQLFEVDARDPLALTCVVGLMIVVAAMAAVVPAWRAAMIDPSRALHDA